MNQISTRVWPAFQRFLALGVLGAAALGAATVAEARDNVYWSVGVGGPGVAVGVSNAPPPRYYAPQPVYVQPAPVYVAPPPHYYYQRPQVVYPAPVYYGPPRYHRHGKHRGHGHHRHGRHY